MKFDDLPQSQFREQTFVKTGYLKSERAAGQFG